eukprot:g58328.t1
MLGVLRPCLSLLQWLGGAQRVHQLRQGQLNKTEFSWPRHPGSKRHLQHFRDFSHDIFKNTSKKWSLLDRDIHIVKRHLQHWVRIALAECRAKHSVHLFIHAARDALHTDEAHFRLGLVGENTRWKCFLSHAEAQFRLGLCFRDGRGATRDEAKTLRCGLEHIV